MSEKPPSFEEFKKQWEQDNARARSLEGMVRKGTPEQRRAAEEALRKLRAGKERK